MTSKLIFDSIALQVMQDVERKFFLTNEMGAYEAAHRMSERQMLIDAAVRAVWETDDWNRACMRAWARIGLPYVSVAAEVIAKFRELSGGKSCMV